MAFWRTLLGLPSDRERRAALLEKVDRLGEPIGANKIYALSCPTCGVKGYACLDMNTCEDYAKAYPEEAALIREEIARIRAEESK